MSSNFNYYPYPDDPDFNKKIYKKKEFYINKTKEVDTEKNIEELMKEKCSGFNLSDNQKFLKTFMSNNTPYNGILLFHGTGVGKTCSSISIAEQYTSVLEKYNKKIIILLNPSIEDNFRKNIFNPGTLKTKKVHQQCLGDKYLGKIKSLKNRDFTREDLTDPEIDNITRKVTSRINSQYRFQGYQQFSNKLIKLKDRLKERPDLYKKRVKEFFSNSVLIIDEAHNIKNTNEGKLIPKILDEVLTYAEEMKLILLTATPMFNEPQEIVFLLNLLLKNDKRETIDEKRVFNPDGSLTDNGRNILAEKSRGIVSYLRGENPLAFPMRFDPPESDTLKEFPTRKYNGETIKDNEKLKHLKIVPCIMTGDQKGIYNTVAQEGFGAFENTGISVSDVVFPGESADNYQSRISNEGFDNNFKKTVKNGKVTIKPKNESAKEMLKLENIGNYSTKMEAIVKSITNKNTQGIVFVYSRYVSIGVVLLGMLLEMQGFTNTKNNLLKNDLGQKKLEKSPKYMIISGDQDLSRNNYINYIKNEAGNLDGSRLKVILGSESASEGLDFKYIREVHVLDPWHHLNKIEQVIGRGIRYCSHIDLPIQQRNVTVVLYAATLSTYVNDKDEDKIETVDLKVYRDAENKDRNMAEITYILKTNSVDCNLNLYANKFTDDYFEEEMKKIQKDEEKKPVDSKKIPRDDVQFKDNNNTRLCNYRSCDFKCLPDLKPNEEYQDINDDTFDATIVVENINQVIEIVKSLFLDDSVLELSDVVKNEKISKKMNVDEEFVKLCLNIMVENEMPLRDKFDNLGKVLKRGDYYIFAPSYLTSDKISLREITRPLEITEDKIDLNDSLSKIILLRDAKLKKQKEKVSKSDILQMYNDLQLPENQKHYLPNNVKELILRYLIKEIKENLLKENFKTNDILYKKFYKDFTLNLSFNILPRSETVDIIRTNKSGSEPYGYYIIEKNKIRVMEWNSETQLFSEKGGDSKKLVVNYLRRKMKDKMKSAASVYAFMELKKDDLVFKVADTKNNTGKNKKSKTTGIILTSSGMSKQALIMYIQELMKSRYRHEFGSSYKKDLAALLTNYYSIYRKQGLKKTEDILGQIIDYNKSKKHIEKIEKTLSKENKQEEIQKARIDFFRDYINKADKSKLYVLVENLFMYNNEGKINNQTCFFTLEEHYVAGLLD